METIIDRAFNAYPKEYPDHAATFDLMCRGGYVKGATEQREIDINEFIQWLRYNALSFAHCDDGTVWYDTDGAISCFEKSMKKQQH